MLGNTGGRMTKCLAFVGLTALAAANAHAGFSPVTAAKPGGELGHAAILSHAYGGSFAADGVNFTNGSVVAERCDDFGDGAKADQCWEAGVVSARVLARFAGYEQSLGVLEGERGGAFRELFTVVGHGLDVSGSAAAPDLGGKPFRFARGGGGSAGIGGAVFSSMQADNLGEADQMVSYRLTGAGGGLERFVLFFEDLGAAENSDWDYNDLVVEVTTSNAVTAIPLPPAVWSALVVMLSGGLWSARARLARWFT